MNEKEMKQNNKQNDQQNESNKCVTNNNSKSKDFKRDRRNDNRSESKSDPKEKKTEIETPKVGTSREDFSEKKSLNDPQWYIFSEETAKGRAELDYNTIIGETSELVSLGQAGTVQIINSRDRNTTNIDIPGLAVYKYMPVYGTSYTDKDTLNRTALDLYTSITNKLSNNARQYDAQDLLMYVFAMDQLYLMVHEMRRLIGLVQMYNANNYLFPRKIIQALGYDEEDLRRNLNSYRSQLNNLIYSINELHVPDHLQIFKRRDYLGNHIFSDDSGATTQLIIPDADGYFAWNAQAISTGTSLIYTAKSDIGTKAIDFGSNSSTLPGAPCFATSTNSPTDPFLSGPFGTMMAEPRTLQTMLDFAMELVNRYRNDSDIRLMSTNIAKAFEGKMFALPTVTEDYTIEVLHDANTLEQFKNSLVLDLPNATISKLTETGGGMNVLNGSKPSLAGFAGLKFRTAKPTAATGSQNPNGEYYSSTPIIYQEGNGIFFAPYLSQISGLSSNFNVTNPTGTYSGLWGNRTASMNAAMIPSSISLKNIIVDTYNENPDYKSNLEITRLITVPTSMGFNNPGKCNTTYTFMPQSIEDLDSGRLNQYVRTNTEPNDYQDYFVYAQIECGVEMGLGWLVHTGDQQWIYALGASERDATYNNSIVLTQWCQFSLEQTASLTASVLTPSVENALRTRKATIVTTTGMECVSINGMGNWSSERMINKYTVTEISKMMAGLDYAPRMYECKFVSTDRATHANTGSLVGAATLSKVTANLRALPGKFGNKTSVFSIDTLKKMNIEALQGLLLKE